MDKNHLTIMALARSIALFSRLPPHSEGCISTKFFLLFAYNVSNQRYGATAIGHRA